MPKVRIKTPPALGVGVTDLGKIARIVGLREELRRKRKELEDHIVEYVKLNRPPDGEPVPWRKLARRIGVDHMHLFRIAKSKGLAADE